jgi:Uma2 family endonuclease
LYARAGVGECWVVNLKDRQVEAHRDPDTSGTTGDYATVRVFTEDETIRPLAAPAGRVAIPVRDLLPASDTESLAP